MLIHLNTYKNYITTSRWLVVVILSRAVCSTYAVVAPQIVRAGSTYDVIVTIFTGTNVNVNVRLHNSRDMDVATNSTIVNAGLSSVAFR